VWLELVLSVFVPFSCITVSMYLARSQVRAGAAQRRLAELEFRARQEALERENAELRVRRELSSVLHDRLQQRLVYAASRLQSEVLPRAVKNEDQLATDLLEDIIADIDRLREHDVRQLSHSLFPLGADLGLHQTIALVLGRVPASVNVVLETSDAAAAFDVILDPQWDVGSRAVLAEILDESITNALKHGAAGAIWVDLRIEQLGREEVMVLTVTNDGRPLRPQAPLSGLANHRIRAQLRGGGLNLGLDEDGRTRLVAWLPTIPVHLAGVPGDRADVEPLTSDNAAAPDSEPPPARVEPAARVEPPADPAPAARVEPRADAEPPARVEPPAGPASPIESPAGVEPPADPAPAARVEPRADAEPPASPAAAPSETAPHREPATPGTATQVAVDAALEDA
jgi:hypothetical protein